MIREVYIMRVIEQIAALVARIMNQKISQESLDEELDGLAEKWIGLPSGMLLALPPEEAFSLIEDSDRMALEKSYLMSELYRLKGVHSQSLDEKKDYFAKSLYFIDKCPGRVSPEVRPNDIGRLGFKSYCWAISAQYRGPIEYRLTVYSSVRPPPLNPDYASLPVVDL